MCRKKMMTILRLTLSWPLVVGAAVAADISVTSTFSSLCNQDGYSTPDGGTHTWSDADNYCSSRGMRLPTKDELVELYTTYPQGQINRTCNWPMETDIFYWSSSPTDEGATAHYYVFLHDGYVSANPNNSVGYVTCVR